MSAEEINDHQSSEKRNHEDKTRSYDCGFCKRGFTNAQALGGHMNIHRKDKMKIKANKQKNQEQPTIQDFHFPQVSSIDQNQTSYYTVPLVKYRVYLPYSSNPSFQKGNLNQQQQYLEEGMDVNLGLGIEERVRGGNLLESEVDLELRLGYDP